MGYWFVFAAAVGMITPIVYIGLVQNPQDRGGECIELFKFVLFVLIAYSGLAVAGLTRFAVECSDVKSLACRSIALVVFIVLGM
jgi:hypothetical protein